MLPVEGVGQKRGERFCIFDFFVAGKTAGFW